MLAVALLAAALAGCAALSAALHTDAALRGAGYQNVSVNISTGTGLPSGGAVRVGYSRGPAGREPRDALHAERIVWDTLSYRFGEVVIYEVAGGCTGAVCVSSSRELAQASYAQLASRFGPRPSGLGTGGSGVAGWAVGLAIGLAVAVVAAMVLVVVLIVRSRRARPGAGLY